jgi:hypothetical protein
LESLTLKPAIFFDWRRYRNDLAPGDNEYGSCGRSEVHVEGMYQPVSGHGYVAFINNSGGASSTRLFSSEEMTPPHLRLG